MNHNKELVTLRQRAMKDGGQSLYLDYSMNGIRTREFLKMYLVPEHTRLDKIKNQETMKLAEGMKAKKILMLQEGRSGIRAARHEDITLGNFINEQKEEYTQAGKPFYPEALDKIAKWMKKYGKKVTLLTLDKDYILGFCRFMGKEGLSQGTVFVYFSVLRTVINRAYRAGRIGENPFSRIDTTDRPKKPDTSREYLTLEEIKKLMTIHCRNRMTEKAFLFSCFTGLRISDIEALTWEMIKDNGKGLQVESRQIKTKKLVYIPLSANAIAQLPDSKRKQGKVFTLPARSTIGEYLNHWIEKAGIDKHISFHCARHTYATLLLTYGADIYTVSSLLGHTNVKTTQIYAKIVDENKRKTVDLIPEIGER